MILIDEKFWVLCTNNHSPYRLHKDHSFFFLITKFPYVNHTPLSRSGEKKLFRFSKSFHDTNHHNIPPPQEIFRKKLTQCSSNTMTTTKLLHLNTHRHRIALISCAQLYVPLLRLETAFTCKIAFS